MKVFVLKGPFSPPGSPGSDSRGSYEPGKGSQVPHCGCGEYAPADVAVDEDVLYSVAPTAIFSRTDQPAPAWQHRDSGCHLIGAFGNRHDPRRVADGRTEH